MFHFPTFPPLTLCVQVRVTRHDSCRVSPFGNPRITARSTAPRGLSQSSTSFFGSWCQGIHRAPLLTWPQRCSRPLCSSQGTGGASTLVRRVRICDAPFDERDGRLVECGHTTTPCSRSRASRCSFDREGVCPLPQDSTACLRFAVPPDEVPCEPKLAGTDDAVSRRTELVSVPPLSYRRDTYGHETALAACLIEAGGKCSLERR